MKEHRRLKTAAISLTAYFLFLLVINMIPPKKNVEANPFLVEAGGRPLIAAHRGGGINYPENTMLAFREAVRTAGADILEGDLHLTKDGHLVFSHKNYIDETCNVNGDIPLETVKRLCEDTKNRHYIFNMTLAELQQYNFGYYFEDREGVRIYKNAEDSAAMGLQIATLDQLFSEFYGDYPELMFLLEIKGSENRGINGAKALWMDLEQYPEYIDRTVVGTFHDEVEDYLRTHCPRLLRGASTESAVVFTATQLLRLNYFDKSDFACLQIPYLPLGLTGASLIRRAHSRNIAVQFWTVNDEKQMRKLIKLGCDCIITDDPLLLKQVMNEYGLLS